MKLTKTLRDNKGRFIKGNQIRLGAKLTQEQISKITNRFKKGDVPWNKNIKSPQLTERNIKNNPMKNPETRKKVSEQFKGKHFSPGTEFKEGQYTGEKHHNWKGGISFEEYNIDFNLEFKNSIRKRDNNISALGLKHRKEFKKSLFVHHINYDKKLSIPQNCISLCNGCHSKTNYNRKYWITFFQSLLSGRYEYGYEEGKVLITIQ